MAFSESAQINQNRTDQKQPRNHFYKLSTGIDFGKTSNVLKICAKLNAQCLRVRVGCDMRYFSTKAVVRQSRS